MDALVEARDLTVHFPGPPRGVIRRRRDVVRAVDGIDLTIGRGETLGLVGESGCGKSTTGRAILQLVRPTRGTVRFEGQELTALRGEPLRRMRRRMQMVFQDPFGSLNPRMTVGDIVAEPLRVHGVARGAEAQRRVGALLERCGLDARFVRRYPHEFSGGQRQRIGIARALALDPDFVVADEPVSALDVSIQAQVLNLLAALKRELRLTFLFIAHDIAAVRYIADRVAVMYLGHVVEIGPTEDVTARPRHPYTQALLSAVPVPDPVAARARRRIVLAGDVPSPLDPPPGCPFHTRCPKVMDRCRVERPVLVGCRGSSLHSSADASAPAASLLPHVLPDTLGRRSLLERRLGALGGDANFRDTPPGSGASHLAACWLEGDRGE